MLEKSIERWVPAPGFEGLYSVSSIGRVRREACVKSRPLPARMLSPYERKDGYLAVQLYPLKGEKKVFIVNVLVLLAFVGPRPAGMDSAHGDGDIRNNCLTNLRWATRKENAADRKLHGTNTQGERNGRALLCEAKVRAIRADKRKLREIAADYGVSHSTIHYAKCGRNWPLVK